MNFIHLLLSFLEIAAITPIGLLCLIIFNKDSKINKTLSVTIYCVIFLVLSVIGGYLRITSSLNINHIILAITIPMLVYPLVTIKGNKSKMLYVFASGGAISSSLRLYGYLLETHLARHHNFSDTQTWGLLLRWVLTILVLVLFAVSIKKIRWLMACDNIDNLWKILWLVPCLFDVANMITVPHNYSLMKLGRIETIFITIITALTIMQLVFHAMLYTIAKTVTEKAQLDKQSQMLSIQASQYKGLQKYIEDTSKLRHDFKHTARTAVALAQEGNNEALIKLLSDYGVATNHSDKHNIFTKHTSLNALVCHYYEHALNLNIKCQWQVRLSEKLGIEDIDLFSIIGNLLENAMQAAMQEAEENRYINFKADAEENGDIYIVVTNGFNGVISKDKDKYLSTKKDGSGIGIESVKTSVAKYNGFVKFYHDQKTFYVDIMLKQNTI